jgi:hypothetical protein
MTLWGIGMMKLDRLSIPVSSARWALRSSSKCPVALGDSTGFGIFLQEATSGGSPNGCVLWFQE